MSKVSLAEQIGALDECIAETADAAQRYAGGREQYRLLQRERSLRAAKATLAFLMNNRDAFLAFMAGKEGA